MTDELDYWLEATKILKEHKKPTLEEGRALIAGAEEIIEKAKDHTLEWNPDNYRIELAHFEKKEAPKRMSTVQSNSNNSMSWKSEEIGNPSWKTNEVMKNSEATQADDLIE